MKETLVDEESLLDPIQSKIHLSNFSASTSNSRLNSREKEGDDELFCQICDKCYKLENFLEHAEKHRRAPREKIPALEEIYRDACLTVNHQKKQSMSLTWQAFIQSVDTCHSISSPSEYKNRVIKEQTSTKHETSFTPESPIKTQLKFTFPKTPSFPFIAEDDFKDNFSLTYPSKWLQVNRRYERASFPSFSQKRENEWEEFNGIKKQIS